MWTLSPSPVIRLLPRLVTTSVALLLLVGSARAGLVGFYSFDDAANPLTDESGNGYDLQAGLADPEYAPQGGLEGGAYTFDGTQRLVAPININPFVLPTLTMGAWVKTASLVPGLRKVMGHDDGGYDRTLGLDTRNGGFRYTAFIGTGDPPPGSPAPQSTEAWTFLAVVYDDLNGQMTLYVDLDSLSIGDALEVTSSPAAFGGGQDLVAIGGLRPDNADEGWLGSLDNVFFFDEALTAEQLTAIRDGGKGAILGRDGEDPDVRFTSVPTLRNLPKSPPVLPFSYGLKNVGATRPLTIAGVTVTGPDAARYAVVNFPSSLAAGASGAIEFTFNSQGQVGAFTAALRIESNDPSTPVLTVDVSAQVGDDPDLVIVSAPNLQDLTKLPAVQTLSFGIQNGGLLDTLRINGITLSGADAAHYTVAGFPATLAPGAAGTIEFTFDNRGQVGTFAASAAIASNDAGTPNQNLDLSARVSGTALLGFYSFDDAGAPLQDDSGNGRTLEIASEITTPIYNATGGVEGGAYEFGGGERLIVPLNINPAQVPVLTMGAWVRTTALDPGLYKAIGHDDGGWDRVIGLDTRTRAGGGPLPEPTYRYAAFTGTNDHGPTQGDPPPTPESLEAWTFLAAVYDQPNTNVTLYVDLDVSSLGDNPQAVSHAAPIGTGTATTALGAIAPGGGEGWVGPIDNAFFLGGRADAALVKSVRDGGKAALLQLRPDPVLAASTAPVFGDLPGPQPVTRTIELRNSGQTQPLQILESRVTGRHATQYALADLPTTIAPGATASLSVTFDPQGQEGSFEGTLDVISNSTSDRHTRFDLAAFVPYGAPLIAFYPFDDAADPLRNARGTGSDLTVPAGASPTYAAAGGVEGGAYQFSGSQRLVAPININPPRLPQLTMGAWVKTGSLSSGLRKVIGHDDGGWDRTIGLDNRDDGSFRYTSFIGNGPPLLGTPGPESADVWSFLAATYDQELNALAFYVDTDVSTTTDPLTVTEGSTGFGSGFPTVAIGGLRPDNADEGWQGAIDNVFFYQTVLDLPELTRIRDGGAEAIVPRPAQPPRITGVTKGTDLQITWSSLAGRTYAVEYTASLPATWSQIGTAAAQGTSTTYTDTDATRLAKPTGFYRVALQP